MSIARPLGNNNEWKYNDVNLLHSLIMNGNKITAYSNNTTYHYDDVVYVDTGDEINIYRAINDNFTDSSFNEVNWKLINVDDFYFGDNSPEISNIEPINKHTKIWIKPID